MCLVYLLLTDKLWISLTCSDQTWDPKNKEDILMVREHVFGISIINLLQPKISLLVYLKALV